MSGIAPKQNTFKFKIAQHKQKSIVTFFGRKMPPSLANRAMAHPNTMVNPTLLIHTCRHCVSDISAVLSVSIATEKINN
jgi:hypothetical protein